MWGTLVTIIWADRSILTPFNLTRMPINRPPSVDSILRKFKDADVPRRIAVDIIRRTIEESRSNGVDDIEATVSSRLAAANRHQPRSVINATGVLLHTNLGRAPWPETAAWAAAEVSVGYSNVELDLETGGRGSRNEPAERLVCLLTGAEAALIVNNNAAALFLTLLALAPGLPVPVSRGELIEIGGSFRLPELMTAAGAQLVEVGTTNRTRLADYAAVADPAVFLKVHPSNYRIDGFSEDTSISELATLGQSRGVSTVFDIGSGLLDDQVPWLAGPPPGWLSHEPGARQALEAGADLVLFSGDKLVGGPQAGIIAGGAELVERLRRHPATRALRVDGATAAALTATLAEYEAGEANVPLWKMATTSSASIEARARRVIVESGIAATVEQGTSTVGGGATPGATIPTTLIVVPHGEVVFDCLLSSEPPVLARRAAGSAVLDLRTVDPTDDDVVAAALRSVRN